MRRSPLFILTALAVLPLAACTDASSTATGADLPTAPSLHRGGGPGVHRQYGKPIKVGNGRARTYVVLDAKRGGAPLELGVALDERALQGLPATGGHTMAAGGDHAGHKASGEMLLSLPERNPTQYRFVELNWNPAGHEPEGVYTVPHFDFHFYTISKAERDAIDPADPAFATKGDNLPPGPFVPAFNAMLAPPGVPASAMAVPRMGVHWSDVRSPELQGMLGNPQGYRPFTATFIYGSWNGRFIFNEPMITRAFLLSKPNVELPVGTAASYTPAGYYPQAYRIQYDPQAKEYLVALTKLTRRQ
jgi:hypothetical protein